MFSISFKLPFSQAVGVARRRGVFLPDEYYSLPPEYRRYAFTVTGLAGLEQIERVQHSLQTALAAGRSFSDWKRELPLEALNLSPARLELIFRTHAQTAYMSGHHRAMVTNAERRPFWMYSAINDARTRPAHRAMSGYIARWDDPIWQRWFPPAGFNCRCTVISLTAAQARARGWPMQDRAVEPDMGFAGKPTDSGKAIEAHLREKLLSFSHVFTQAFDRALEMALRPNWLNRMQLGFARVGLAAAMRENPGLAGLTAAEFYAIRRYSENAYKEINRRLRFDIDASRLRPIQVGMVQSIASAIRKLEGGVQRTLFRGGRVNQRQFNRMVSDYVEGRYVTTSGFLSTSLDRETALAFSGPTTGRRFQVLFEIETQRGMRIDVISVLGHELEILIAPGTTFRVVSAGQVGDVLIVRLRDGTGRSTIGLSA